MGTHVAALAGMGKLTRMVPWIGAMFAFAGLVSTIRRKGVVRGTVDAALDITPVLGGVKMVAERLRGRDLIADRPGRSLAAATKAGPGAKPRTVVSGFGRTPAAR